MAKFKVIWTKEADDQKNEIFQYWNHRNKSEKYSLKLLQLINQKIDLISSFPNIGYKTPLNNTKILIIDNYLLIYKRVDETIFIQSIIDGRRDPDFLKDQLGLQDL